jgi:hypothetical protein
MVQVGDRVLLVAGGVSVFEVLELGVPVVIARKTTHMAGPAAMAL